MFGLALLFVLGKRERIFLLIVHLFVSYAHVKLCHLISSVWCRGLAAAFACGSSCFFLFFFLFTFFGLPLMLTEILIFY